MEGSDFDQAFPVIDSSTPQLVCLAQRCFTTALCIFTKSGAILFFKSLLRLLFGFVAVFMDEFRLAAPPKQARRRFRCDTVREFCPPLVAGSPERTDSR